MTREEIVKIAKGLRIDFKCESDIIVDFCNSIIKELEQEPSKGHWEVVSDGYGDNAYICECSECKDTVWVYKDADRKWNFCPNCGADMREVQE